VVISKETHFYCFESRDVECKKLLPHEASSIPSLARFRSHLKLRKEMWIKPDLLGFRMKMNEDVENEGLIFCKRPETCSSSNGKPDFQSSSGLALLRENNTAQVLSIPAKGGLSYGYAGASLSGNQILNSDSLAPRNWEPPKHILRAE
jgi:hypothetical protein